MIIKNTDASQSFSVIPRSYGTNFTMEIRDDSTNKTTLYEISDATTVGDYLTFTKTLNPVLVDNHFYDLALFINNNIWNTNYNLWNEFTDTWNKPSNTLLFRDKIFCTDPITDQSINDNYDINKDVYSADDSYNNEYIVV